jgi:hypothetical protein
LKSYYCLLTLNESESPIRQEIQSDEISAAVAEAYQIFAERHEARVLELWEDYMILKLERSST